MRLFIAINLGEDVKDRLTEVTENLKGYAVSGSFTIRHNYANGRFEKTCHFPMFVV